MDARPHCYACDTVASHCICARVDGVDNRTAITLVQHPRERRHPFGTARIARLGLSNFAMHVLEPDDPLDVPRDAAVLFPDPGAPSLTELPPSSRPRHLVVIDGTWAHASQLRRNHPSLAPLSAVTLPPGPPSRYRIRREPSDEAISTIEAIVRALRVLEPETRGVDGLLDTFDAMIDDQLETRSAHAYSPRHRRTPRLPKPLPEVLLGPTDDVVLVHAELHMPRGQARRFPLRVTAARTRPGPRVDALVESPIPPSDSRWRNLELEGDTLAATLSLDALAPALARVIREGDTLLAWAQPVCDLLAELGFDHPTISVKHVYANQHEGRVGSLDDVMGRLGDPPLDVWAPGRAGRQLAQLARVVERLRER